MSVDQALLRKLFDYDPSTGVVTRLVCTANRHVVGEPVGSSGARGYLQATIHSKKYPLHRLIWMWMYGKWPPQMVDHIDRDRTNNRLSNLRCVTHAENCHNQGRGRRNWSDYIGVSWDKSRCLWTSGICVDGRRRNLGRFLTPELASAAYLAAKAIHHPTAPKATS